MIERLFTTILTFAVLTGGTLAIGSELFTASQGATPELRIATLPRVVVTGSRQTADTALAQASAAAQQDRATPIAQ
jgi:hypothetical protein